MCRSTVRVDFHHPHTLSNVGEWFIILTKRNELKNVQDPVCVNFPGWENAIMHTEPGLGINGVIKTWVMGCFLLH